MLLAPNPTALANFAALGGQFRVSLTPICKLNCWFCHNETDVPPHVYKVDRTRPPRRRNVDAQWITNVISDVVAAGVRRVYFTGGEPLSSPLARPVLESIPEWGGDDVHTALITNGIDVPAKMPWLRHCALDKIKVSLHYISDESFAAIAGTPLPISAVLNGIETARDAFERIELNCLVQEENAHELDRILGYAVDRRLPIQFIELVDTGNNQGHPSAEHAMTRLLARLRESGPERIEVAGVGQGRRVFAVDGVPVEVIDRHLGRHHVGQCGTCPLKASCVEGFWSLRLGHDGVLSPCLLREDLRLDLTGEAEPAAVIAGHVAAFTEGLL